MPQILVDEEEYNLMKLKAENAKTNYLDAYTQITKVMNEQLPNWKQLGGDSLLENMLLAIRSCREGLDFQTWMKDLLYTYYSIDRTKVNKEMMALWIGMQGGAQAGRDALLTKLAKHLGQYPLMSPSKVYAVTQETMDFIEPVAQLIAKEKEIKEVLSSLQTGKMGYN